MNYLDDFILSTIFLLFPIMIYLFFLAYDKNISKDDNRIMLCFALFSSIYLILSKNYIHYPRIALWMANIAIIIAYLRKCPIEAVMISMFLIFIIKTKYNLSIYAFSIEYISYFLIYLLNKKYNINKYLYIFIYCLIHIEILVLFSSRDYYDDLFFTIIISVFLTYVIIILIEKGDSILKYHIAYKELFQEKQIRTSLFKITHEIKNPLSVCKGYFDMLDVNNVIQCQRYIPIIRDEVNHALFILKDFSDLSKIKVEKELIDISYVLEETINNLREFIASKDIKLTYKGIEEVYIDGDYKRLMQVFINILKNSVEALENKKNKRIRVELSIDSKDIRIIFKDNGCGMSEDILKEFDKPFFTTKQNGTGLGTTLSNEIIKSHDGKIEYESILNKGTTAIITIPKKTTNFN